MGAPFKMMKRVGGGRYERVIVNPDTKESKKTGEVFRPLRDDEDPEGREVVSGVQPDGTPMPKMVKE